MVDVKDGGSVRSLKSSRVLCFICLGMSEPAHTKIFYFMLEMIHFFCQVIVAFPYCLHDSEIMCEFTMVNFPVCVKIIASPFMVDIHAKRMVILFLPLILAWPALLLLLSSLCSGISLHLIDYSCPCNLNKFEVGSLPVSIQIPI